MSGREEPGLPGDLLDLPLREDRGEAFSLPLASEGPPVEAAVPRAAPPSARVVAAAADASVVALVVAIDLLVAASLRDRWPSVSGLLWVGAFAVYFSFFAVVVPLFLFGRTVGMALSGLSAVPRGGSRRLTPREAALRWAGTLLTFGSLGLSLLFTRSEREAPTLADGLSGRPLLATDPPAEDA
ncbi:MAG TPA: RDD family protein [Thermoanaerobaculia bacterium]|nr:RDD family protein [Thermoanaerobaculia bacterium]